MWKRLSVVHTILFALLSALSLFATNLDEFVFSQMTRSLLVLLLVAALFLYAWRLRFREIEKAAFLSSLTLMLTMNYGHAYNLLLPQISKLVFAAGFAFQLSTLYLVTHFVVTIIWLGLITLTVWVIGRQVRLGKELTQFFLILSVVAVLIPTITIVSGWKAITSDYAKMTSFGPEIDTDDLQSEAAGKPDIYYIILDAYTREDILQEFFQHDNSEFTDQLQAFGFWIADKSRSNYSNTNSSLASSLNMTYLDQDLEIPSDDLECASYFAQATASSRVINTLKDLGYQIVSFKTGFRTTEMMNADLYLHSEKQRLNVFENYLLQNSFFSLIFDLSAAFNGPFEFPNYAAHRDLITFILDHIATLPSQSQPRFVFAHVVAPHPPFVFEANGEAVDQNLPFGIGDGDYFPGTREDYIKGYVDQVKFVNKSILKIVQDLIRVRQNQPVILIQGDHGSRLNMVWSQPSIEAMREGVAILNAYYMPGVDNPKLYDEISPVNSFRVVFNAYFNAGLELLPDRSYLMATGCQDSYNALPEETELLNGDQ